MKRIYFIIALCFGAVVSEAQFEIRLVEPGGEDGKFRVQFRCSDPAVLPTTSNWTELTDMSFRIWWPNGINVADIDVVQADTYLGNLNESNPAAGFNNGSSGTPGNVVGIGFCTGCSAVPLVNDWLLNEWVTVATVSICSLNNCASGGLFPPGIDASSFQIQNPFQGFPNIGWDFNDFTPAEGPLPLDLVNFTASKYGTTDALLKWTTVNEQNTSHFTIQRSYNKELWFDVGEEKAAAFSTEIKNYNFTDYQVYNGRDARLQVYYRLNMVDIDGRQRYSPMQSVVFGNGLATTREFAVYPNPASDGVHVEWDANQVDQPTAIELYDVAGKLVLAVPVSDQTNQQYIDFKPTRIQSGLYLMRIMHNDEAIEHKQIVVGRTD